MEKKYEGGRKRERERERGKAEVERQRRDEGENLERVVDQLENC